MPKTKKALKKGKKPHKNKPTSQKWKKYDVSAGIIKRAKTCPRCGSGIFLLEAKNRVYCGKCYYTEFKKRD